MTKTFENKPTDIYKVVPAGDGSLYTWARFTEEGEKAEEGTNYYPAAADAEKFLRSFVKEGHGKLEVSAINNVNTPDNVNVNLVRPKAKEDVFNGMTPVEETIEEKADKKKEEVSETKAKKADK